MRQLFILILSTCSICVHGQADTLTADKLDFEFLGQNGTQLKNVGQSMKLIVHYQAANSAFYKLRLNHQQGENYRTSITCDLNLTKNKTGHDTISFPVNQPVPGDKFVLEYFQNPKFKREFDILSTVASDNRPYYTDIAFVYNGDTLNTSKYLLLGQKIVLVNEKLLRVPTDKLTKFTIEFKHKRLTYELPTEVVYHKFVIVGYVDKIKTIEKKVQKTKEYTDPIKFMKEYGLTKIRLIKTIDIDDKREVGSQYSQAW